MKLKHHSLLFTLTLLGTGLAPASVHLTVDRSDGSWTLGQTSNVDNTVDWIHLDDGFIDPFTPNTNNQAQITMVGVPEPAALLLGAIGSLSLLLHRRR